MAIKNEFPSKEYYAEQMEIISEIIKERIEDTLFNWDSGIRGITIHSELSPDCIPTVEITKEYFKKKEVKTCHLKEKSEEMN